MLLLINKLFFPGFTLPANSRAPQMQKTPPMSIVYRAPIFCAREPARILPKGMVPEKDIV